jgi:hypothetical protein
MFGMGRINTTSMAHRRVILAEDPADARKCLDIRHSIKDWSVPLVRKPNSARLPTASEALAGASGIGGIQLTFILLVAYSARPGTRMGQPQPVILLETR